MTPAQLLALSRIHQRMNGGGETTPKQADPQSLFALAAMPRS